MSYPFIIQGQNITVVIDNKPYSIGPTHIAHQKVMQAIKDQDWDAVRDLVEPKTVIMQYAEGNIRIDGENLLWNGKVMHNSLSSRMIQMYKEGFSITPMVNFIDRLMRNPSSQSIKELYGFLEKNLLPITPDGYFLAYKRVNDTYLDVHSNSVCNKPAELMSEEELAEFSVPVVGGVDGEVTVQVLNGVTCVSMARNQVDDVRDNTCSSGLHFCSEEYLGSFSGARIVVVKIDPADVVSIPSDYNDAKGRCCAYQVVGEVKNPNRPAEVFTGVVDDNYKVNDVAAPALRKIQTATGERWIRSNGTYASKEEIAAYLGR